MDHSCYSISISISILFIFIFLIYLFVILYTFYSKNRNKKTTKIPEPSGSLPLIGHLHLLTGRTLVCKKLSVLADKLGPIYSLKIGFHRLLVVSEWEIVKECFTKNDRVLATRPNIAVGKYMGYNNAAFTTSPYGHYWREIRKISTVELFSSHRLALLSHVRSSEVDAFIKKLYETCCTSEKKMKSDRRNIIEMNEHFDRMTFNIILKVTIGKRFSNEDYDDNRSECSRYKEAIIKAVYLSGVFVVSDAIPFLERFDIGGHLSSMKNVANEMDEMITNWVEEHLVKNSEKPSDFIDVLLSSLPEDVVISGYTRGIIVKATAQTLIFTGGESTAITLTWAISLLLNNRTALKTAQQELDNVVGKQRWVDESDINKLNYLQAVIKETLRLYPPAPITGPREAMEDCTINGYRVPKGTRLIVNLWKLHRDGRVWNDPNSFKPERFLMGRVDDKDDCFKYMPFSFGRRSCPGYNFGLQVVRLGLARLLQGFDIEPKDGKFVDMEEGLGISLPKVNPVEVVLKPRLSSKFYQNL